MKHPTEYYEYDQLPTGSIRLLRLHGTERVQTPEDLDVEQPLARENQLVISLESFELAKCPDFIALSYTWGQSGSLSDPKPSVFTQVERVFPTYCDHKILRNTENLRAALRRIRWLMKIRDNEYKKDHPAMVVNQQALSETSYLWADALCINQDNLEERAVQVQNMGEIYKRAQRTIVWLGESGEYTDGAIKAVLNIQDSANEALEKYVPGGKNDVELQTVKLDAEEMRAYIAFLNRKWFQRAWIVQEILLSSGAFALIGSKLIGFDVLLCSYTVKQLAEHRLLTSVAGMNIGGEKIGSYSVRAHNCVHFLSYLQVVRKRFFDENKTIEFMKLMRLCVAQKCSDPRDKIYSLLAICREFNAGPVAKIMPDYTKDIDEVFIQATQVVISTRQDLLVLQLVTNSATITNLPSWSLNHRSMLPTFYPFSAMPTPRRFSVADVPPIEVSRTELLAFGQCVAFVEEKAIHAPLFVDSRTMVGPTTGPAYICALLTRLETTEKSCARLELQNLSRVEIFWRTLLPQMPSLLTNLADIDHNSPLPCGAAALLPTVLRLLLVRHLNFWSEMSKETRKRSDTNILTSELHKYGQILENALEQLKDLEPDDAVFLPNSGEMAQICSAAVRSPEAAVKTAMLLNRQDRIHWSHRGKALGSNMRESSLGNPSARQKLLFDFSEEWEKIDAERALGLIEVMTTLQDLRLFRTDNHLLGLTSCPLAAGDQLWILDGAHAPVILRPLLNGKFRYLGDTYMHGMMNGEAIPLCQSPSSISIE